METAMQIDIRPAPQQASEFLFDWQVDVERLEREAQAAAERRQADDWALVEAECSLDLIDAELSAAHASRSNKEVAAATIRQLSEWRARVERTIRKLRSLQR
jgi:hypothetical protein